jgi:hypothetical protein
MGNRCRGECCTGVLAEFQLMSEDTVHESLDVQKLSQLIDDVKRLSAEQVFEKLAGPGVDDDAVAAVTAECSFDHEATLVFPDNVTDVAEFLRERGFEVAEPVPSVVVQERISRRYDLAGNDLNVSILQASVRLKSGARRGVEVFCLPREQATPAMIAREQKENNESHFAFKVECADSAKLGALRSIFIDQFSMRPDGGGYNPYDDAQTGGRSVLYFSSPGGGRLELTCAGNFREVVAAHRRSRQDAHRGQATMRRAHASRKRSKSWSNRTSPVVNV